MLRQTEGYCNGSISEVQCNDVATYAIRSGDAEFIAKRMVSNEDFVNMAKTLNVEKAPVRDGIPNGALEVAILAYPDMFRSVFIAEMPGGRHFF